MKKYTLISNSNNKRLSIKKATLRDLKMKKYTLISNSNNKRLSIKKGVL